MLVSGRKVERAISKRKSILAMLVVESTSNGELAPFSPLVQPLLQAFGDVFPQDVPPDLLSKRGVEH